MGPCVAYVCTLVSIGGALSMCREKSDIAGVVVGIAASLVTAKTTV
jgi:hypothetical protein